MRQAKPRCGARCEVLHDDVRVLDDQALQDCLAFGMLDIERQAFFRAIGPNEMRREAFDALVVCTREIPDTGPLDLDDACSDVGKLARAERRSDRVLERDDRYSIEGTHFAE